MEHLIRRRNLSHIPPAIPNWLPAAFVGSMVLLMVGTAYGQESSSATFKTVRLRTSGSPPEWAFWQRHALEQCGPAAHVFVSKYTTGDGELIWRDEWPGMDGSDDGYESFYNFPLLYALGGDADIAPLSERLWNAVTEQFTRYGQIYREFDAHYDWMHHGESYTYFYFFGLSNPKSEQMRQRAERFARLYTTDNSDAPNYDPKLRLIRSPLTGSRGPHFNPTAEDWVTHRPILAGYPLPFDDIPHVTSSEVWNDDRLFPFLLETMNRRMMRGDVPLNMTSTSMIANAYMYTGDDDYRSWITGYVQEWIKRAQNNKGILPDNVGLSGKIGEHMNGKWWGGYYGWHWPHGLFNLLESTTIGATNAYLVSGNPKYLELPRSVIDLVVGQGREENGQLLVPHKHGDKGWYEYRPLESNYLVHLWFASRTDEDRQRLENAVKTANWPTLNYHKSKGDSKHALPWLAFVLGKNDEYPLQILKACCEETRRRMLAIHDDRTTPDAQDVHHWLNRNPVVLEGLIQTMLGAPNHIYHGGLLHSTVRYFDPDRRRPGVPPDVAVLVERLTPNGFRLQCVNLNPAEPRRLLIQAGMFGEHSFTRVSQVEHYPFQFDTVDGPHFIVHLTPGTVGRLQIGLRRYVNQPTYSFRWE